MIEDFDAAEVKKPTARVALCQIALSDEMLVLSGQPSDYSKNESIWRRVERTLKEIDVEKPDVVQFPECSIPQDLIGRLADYSRKKDIIIIAGTHYTQTDDGFVSRCPVIFPQHGVIYTEKMAPSPLEKRPISGKSVIPGERRIFFRNTRIGDFFIYICSDFLEGDPQNDILIYNPDLIFISAFQSTSAKHYYNEIDAACGVSASGCYCLYSNVKSKSMADGGSAIFGITDRVYQSAYQESGLSDMQPVSKVWEAKSDNDYVVADLDLELKKPETPKRPSTKPNIAIVSDRSRLNKRKTKKRHFHEYRLAVFDMDGTLLRGIVFSWVKLWELCGDDGTLWRDYLNKYRKGELEYDRWCAHAVDYFRNAGLTKDLIFDVAREQAYVVENLEKGLADLRSMGFKLALVSGGVDIFMRALMPKFQEYFDEVHINKLHFDAEDVVSNVDVTPFDYDGKALAIEKLCSKYGFDIEESIFVGDSYNDDAALKKAGYSIVFGLSEDGVKHVSNKHIEGEDFMELVNHIKSIHQPSLLPC